MTRKSSIKIKPRNIASALLHNARVFSLSYAVKDKSDNENKLYITPAELKKLLRNINADYQRHSYRGRKMPTNATPIREGVVNLEAHHTLEDVERVAMKIAKNMGVEVLAISVHRDEGKDAENINYHAHILFNYYNFDMHKMTHHFKAERIMEQVQDIVAEELDMERGISKEITGIEHVPHQQWRHIQKQREQEKQEQFKTVTELKAKLNELAIELREANGKLEEHQKLFNKEDYQQINALKKKLNKTNLDEVAVSYYELSAKFKKLKDENERFRNERSGEYQRVIDRVKQSTERLSGTTEADIEGATKAFKAEREARADAEIVATVANELEPVLEGVQGTLRQIVHERLVAENMALKRNSLLSGVKTIAEHTNLAEKDVVKAISKGVRIRAVEFVDLGVQIKKIEGAIEEEDFFIAHGADEVDFYEDDFKEPNELDISYLRQLTREKVEYISKKVSGLIHKLLSGTSEEWQKLEKWAFKRGEGKEIERPKETIQKMPKP